MKLNLKEIIHVPGSSVPFDYELDGSDLEFYGKNPVTGSLQVSGAVRNMADALMLEGTVTATLSLNCDRCTKPFTQKKSVSLDTLLATELENEENDDIILLDGTELDLDELATTAFILAMDMKNLCSEDCKGLCSGCGVDLNVEACRCKPEVDPRLAALAQLLDDKTE